MILITNCQKNSLPSIPAAQRDHSRLLVMDKYTGAVEHRVFRDIVDYLHAGDVLVLNNTKVIPARIFGVKEGGTAKIEVLLLKRDDDLPNTWEVLVHPGKRAKVGTVIDFGEGRLKGEVIANTSAGRKVTFHFDGIFEEILEELGTMPLPPYIHEQLEDQKPLPDRLCKSGRFGSSANGRPAFYH